MRFCHNQVLLANISSEFKPLIIKKKKRLLPPCKSLSFLHDASTHNFLPFLSLSGRPTPAFITCPLVLLLTCATALSQQRRSRMSCNSSHLTSPSTIWSTILSEEEQVTTDSLRRSKKPLLEISSKGCWLRSPQFIHSFGC